MRTMVLAVVFGVACAPGPGADLGDRLTETTGCGDVFLFAHDVGSTLLLGVIAPDILGEATDPETEFTWSLPDPAVTVTLEEGRNVADAACDDVLEGDVVVRHASDATEGTLTITVRPNAATDELPRVDATLEDVRFEEEGRERATIDVFTLDDVAVGWLAG